MLLLLLWFSFHPFVNRLTNAISSFSFLVAVILASQKPDMSADLL